MLRVEALERRDFFTVTLPSGVLNPAPPAPAGITINLYDIRVNKVGRELRIDGGIGNDVIGVAQVGTRLNVSYGANYASYLRSDIDRVRINGNSGNDSLSCTASVNVPVTINGGLGDDLIGGGGANDTLGGDAGNDRFLSGPGSDTYRGGAGVDAFDGAGLTGALTISLDGVANDGRAGEGDNVFPDVEELRGTTFNDAFSTTGTAAVRFFGFGGNDDLRGGTGNDLLDAGAGDDRLTGNAGNDELIAGEGSDQATGGAGTDTFRAGAATRTLVLVTSSGNSSTGFFPNFDRLQPDIEVVHGTASADKILGGHHAERIFAGGGNDEIHGRGGNDVLHGDDGDDLIFGDVGRDELFGDAGKDTLIDVGGGVEDRFTGGTGDDVIWADDDATERVLDTGFTESRQRFVNRVARYNNGAGLEPRGERLENPGLGSSTAVGYADFSANPIFGAPPSVDDIAQGAVGDCWYMAAAGGVAIRNPDYLRGMIVPLGDHTYGVRLADQFYRIDGQFPVKADGALAYAGLGQGNGIWVALTEKAMVLHRATGLPHNNNQYNRLATGSVGEGFANFGFNEQGKRYPWLDAADLDDDFNWVVSQLADGRAVGFCTGIVLGDSHLVAFHCYDLISAYVDAEGQRRMVIRNPWGSDHTDPRHIVGADDGYIDMRYGDVNSSVIEWVSCVTSL